MCAIKDGMNEEDITQGKSASLSGKQKSSRGLKVQQFTKATSYGEID